MNKYTVVVQENGSFGRTVQVGARASVEDAIVAALDVVTDDGYAVGDVVCRVYDVDDPAPAVCSPKVAEVSVDNALHVLGVGAKHAAYLATAHRTALDDLRAQL